MKRLLIFTFFLSMNAHAMDSFSLMRSMGSSGDLGNEVLQLNCVKQKCELSNHQNESITSRKTLKRSEADVFFKQASKVMTASHRPASANDQSTPAEVSLDWKGKKHHIKFLSPALLNFENQLRARLRS